MPYTNQAFSYVASRADQIKSVAAALGISEMAIAGAIAEEYDSFLKNPNLQLALDAYADIRLSSHSDIVKGFNQTKDIADTNVSKLDKLMQPTLIDAGPANIRITTAVRLFEGYSQEYLQNGSDPLGLAGYQNDYRQMLKDLINPGSGLTEKMTGLMIQEADRFFSQNADPQYWSNLTQEVRDAINITYFNNGPEAIKKMMNESLAEGKPYEPKPGGGVSGGETFLENQNDISFSLDCPELQLIAQPLIYVENQQCPVKDLHVMAVRSAC